VARWERVHVKFRACRTDDPHYLAVDHVPEDTRGPLLEDLLAQLDELTKTDQTSTPKLVLVEANGSWKRAA